MKLQNDIVIIRADYSTKNESKIYKEIDTYKPKNKVENIKKLLKPA